MVSYYYRSSSSRCRNSSPLKRIDIVFKRTGQFIMRGAASIDIDEGEDWREAAKRLQFSEFLPINMAYDDENWEFDTVYVEADNDEED